MSNILESLKNMNGVTIHEARMITPALAKITATVVGSSSRDQRVEALAKQLKNGASVVRDSFRFIDNKTMVGYVHASREVRAFDHTVKAKFRAVAANMFMDKEDETLWEMKEGAGGKYLTRQGHDDLSSLIEEARVSPRGSTPRIAAIVNSSVAANDMVAYVVATKWTAEVDYGFCVKANNDGSYRVVSASTKELIDVTQDSVVASYEIDAGTLPRIPKCRVAASSDPLAGQYPLSSKELSWEEYYKMAYAYAPEYVDKIIDQIRQMSAA